jgi:hypothetical protein
VGQVVRHRPATGRLCGETVVTDGGRDPGTATGIALIGRARPWTIRHEETTGTPGLFTLTPVGKHGLAKAAARQDRYQLTLW